MIITEIINAKQRVELQTHNSVVRGVGLYLIEEKEGKDFSLHLNIDKWDEFKKKIDKMIQLTYI